MIKLRDWQQEASSKCLEWYSKKEDNRFIINAAPGTGKTICAISIADELIKQNLVERVVVIAPMNTVVDQWAKTYQGLTNRFMQQSTKLSSDEGVDICCTWASVSNLLDGFQKICKEKNTMVICDEHHHAAVTAVWGKSAGDAFKNARFVLVLTGTPIRSDAEEPVWLSYKDGELSHPKDGQFTLTYGDSIKLGYCRPTVFHRHEANFLISDGNSKLGTVSGKSNEIEEEIKGTAAAAMLQESNRFYNCAINCQRKKDGTPVDNSYQQSMLEHAIEKLEERKLRLSQAGGLVIAPNIKVAEYMCELLEILTKKKPVLVHSGPEIDNADKKIDRFRHNLNDDWLVSVDMIGEGVDIQRLRVLVYLPRARTELKFRQAMGRIVRKYEGIANDDSTAYCVMPAAEIFDKYARRVEDEIPGEHLRGSRATKKCPSCETENKREAKHCISKSCDHEFPKSGPRFKKCSAEDCDALNPVGAKSCQECGEEFGQDFEISLVDVFRDGIISRGADISEQDVKDSESIAENFYDMIKKSTDPVMKSMVDDFLKKYPLETVSYFNRVLSDAMVQSKKTLDKNKDKKN